MSEFKPGQRVKWTDKAVENGVVPLAERSRNPYGTVTSISRISGNYIQVRRDGRKNAARYHVEFWEDASK